MATNHTEHYGLSLWEGGDKFYHEEFNENHRKIDDALHHHAAALDTKADAAQTAASIQSLEERKAAVVTGTYIGSGLYGQTHPNRLSFAFTPKLVIVRPQAGINLALVLLRGMTSAMFTVDSGNDAHNNCTVTWTETGVSWYTGHTHYQYNNENEVYLYLAIG